MNKFGSDNLTAFICSHVFENTKPILFVCHEGGDWQFLCGGNHDVNELPKVVCIGHLLERDSTLNEVADLPVDWEAERTATGEQWVKIKLGE